MSATRTSAESLPPGKGTRAPSGSSLSAIRRFLLGLLLLGLLATGADLLLLAHYENPWQLLPLVLVAAGLVVVFWHALRQGRTSLRVLQSTMVLFLAAAVAGFVLHFLGNREFQLEANPSLGGMELVWKVIRAKAPPALAPGSMAQLGLLGLVYSYRHPSLGRGPAEDDVKGGST